MLWIASDKVLQDKAFSIAKNPKYDGYQRGLASIVYKVFDKKSSNAHSLTWINFDVVSKNKRPSDLAKELHEPIIKKFEKQKVSTLIFYRQYLECWFSRYAINKYIWWRNSFCVIDIYSKYAWVVPLKDKKGITTTNTFQKILDESIRKPIEIWVDKCSELYNRSVKSWLEDNDIEMYSTNSEGKSAAAKRFFRTSKNKIYKHTTSI